MELNKLELYRQEMVNYTEAYIGNNWHIEELIKAAQRKKPSEWLEFLNN